MRTIGLLVLAVGALLQPGASAAASPCEDEIIQGSGATSRVVTACPSPGSFGNAPSPGSPSPAADQPARFWGTQLLLGPARGGPDGFTCYELVSVSFASPSERDAHEGRMGRIIASVQANTAVYLRCDVPPTGGDTKGPAPPPTPGQVAEAFLNAVDFEPPAPRIQPGYAIAGLPAFLEPGGTEELAPVTRANSPYGAFRAEARQSLSVHWGQGAVDAESGESGWVTYGDRSGGPWPDGDISFVYRDPGTVTVQVVRDWTFEWSFADGPAGTLSFALDGDAGPFEVDEVQAVRVR